MAVWIFIRGIIIGLMVSIPIGPVGVLILQRSVNKGRASGMASGFGAATADLIFATIAVLGLSFILEFIQKQHIVLEILGGLFIIFIGLKIFYTNPIIQLKKHRRHKTPLFQDYISMMLLTLSNPLAIFIFIALFAGVNLVSEHNEYLPSFLIVLGVFSGAILWWFVLSGLTSIFRHKFRLRWLFWINKTSGLVIASFGIIAIINAILNMMHKGIS
jgi:threonine/homoserine/homoserine lactone efflux protein